MWKAILPALFVLGVLFVPRPTVALAAGSTLAVLAEAQTALDNGDAAQARRLVEEGLKEPGLEPLQRARLLLDRGLAGELLGSHDQALVDFTAAINIHALPVAEQAQALLQRGFLLDSMGRLGPALGDYTAVIALAPDSAKTALNNRANIYRRQNRLKQAERDYRAALQGGNPHPEYPYTGLGQIAEAKGDTEAARRYYAQAVAANAHYAPAIERLDALGGPPPNAVADPGVVHLRPPAAQPASADAPVVLRPPPDVLAAQAPGMAPVAAVEHPSASIHLHMPRKAAPARAAPRLRPAIDGAAAGGGPLVQLGAWRSRAEAEAGWDHARQRAGGVLDGLSQTIVTADLPGKGRYYRLRVAPGPPGARALCDKLGARGQDCLVVRN
jgi:tetratricopeptide (TPR) repeat protein